METNILKIRNESVNYIALKIKAIPLICVIQYLVGHFKSSLHLKNIILIAYFITIRNYPS